MKKWIALIFAIATYLPANALPLGNPAEPSLFSKAGGYDPFCNLMEFCGYESLFNLFRFSAGYYGDFVFDRYMKNKIPATVRRTRLATNAAFLAINLCDRLDIFTTLGTTRIILNATGGTFRASSSLANPERFGNTVESKNHFSWSVGARTTLFECRSFGLGAEGQYFRINSTLNFYSDGNRSLAYLDVPMRYSEWQIGVGAFYKLSFEYDLLSSVVPYVGVKASRAHLDMDNSIILPEGPSTTFVQLLDLRSRGRAGFAFGLTAVVCHRLALTAEGRIGDERALYVNGQFRY